MDYREFPTIPALERLVECFWSLESDAGPGPVQPERILPDGCVELILNFGARFQEHKENAQKENQPLNYIVGQMTRPILIAPTGSVQLLGIRFHPGGTFPFFRIPMQQLTNQVVDLGALAGKFERDLLARTGAAGSIRLKIKTVEELLVHRMRSCKLDSWLAGLAMRIVQSGGQVSVDTLATDAGVSSRQLERRFLREVGIGPKLLCRILRFQQIFRAIDRNDSGWAATAADCGYYDQAHLIRDFQQFAWQTPSTLLEHSSALTQSFTRKNRRSDFSNTAELSTL
jgi:AraC-like DNA-binding protein